MADDTYRIPWSGLDIGPGAAFIQAAYAHRDQNERANEYLSLQRQALKNSAERASHELERDKEREAHKRAIEAWTAMPMLQRAAMRSVGMANTNPYGVKFDETRDLPANVEGPEVSPEAEAARFAPKAGVPSPQRPMPAPVQASRPPLVDPPFQLHPDEEGPEQFPGPEEDRFFLAEQRQPRTTVAPMVPVQADSLDALGDDERRAIAENITSVGTRTTLATPNVTGRTPADPRMVSLMDDPSMNEPITANVPRELAPQTPDAEIPSDMPAQLPLMMQAATNSFAPGPEGKRRIFATYQGNRFEVPEQSETTGLGAKYDAIYQRMLQEPGAKPDAVFAKVLADYEKDQADIGRDRRLAQTLGFRDKNREDTQDFGREMGLNREDRLSEAEKNRIAAMERVKEGGKYRVAASAPTLKIDTANRQDMGSLRAGFKEWKNTVNLAIDSKSHKRLATAMSNLDSGNAMQEREAAESLVAIFKGGGQVTKASQDLLLKHLAGIVGDAQTWLQHLATGNFGSMELNVLKQATRNALKEEQEKLHGYYESAVDTFGPGSGYEQLGGNVNAMTKGAFKQFGYNAPSIYPDTAESVVLGSGMRPKAPTAKPSAKTVTIRNKKTGETKEVSLEEARRMGAAP